MEFTPTEAQTPTSQHAETPNAETQVKDMKVYDGNKYFPYTASFVNDNDTEVEATLYFRRPMRPHIMTIANAGKNKSLDTQKEVLIQLVLPEQRTELRTLLDLYILLVGCFADEIFKSAGAGAVFKG